MLVEREYAGLVKHENMVLGKRWWHGCVEEGIVKWVWGSFGVCARVKCAAVRVANGVRDSWESVPSLCSSAFLGSTRSTWVVGHKVRAKGLHFNVEELTTVYLGFVTNRRLLLSSSGKRAAEVTMT